MIPKLFIVDDEKPARSRLITLLSDIAAECPHQLVGEAGHAQGALDGIAATRPDIVLLDVQIPGMGGIELASCLSENMDIPPAVIFITAFDNYAVKAFEVRAFDYLVKPVRAARLADAIRRVTALRGGSAANQAARKYGETQPASARQHFAVQERGRLLLVPVSDVLFLKAELKYVTLRTSSGEYLIEESLTSIEEELSGIFVRVHRNALVARNAILGVERGSDGNGEKGQESWQVILRDTPERLPVSRRQWPVVKALVRSA